ncbi:DUF3685 domain-containing protein [Thermosynechococcaceae cyanobacterium BACA0444]|uniref:DUF3685 domain-containing protein n=1 Tax=Pseudocalidococcus azoricus BACA0444 TaxID=2918990 RepID=A0AAE4FQJ6_9CYAN|nr:DUF3685 domain-containing protein [Pseudocalidococcus azoricus]MDS3859853.1 DUF3685 domain-containing protein [Pseudocalidococcus azoricus BACA0444]
MISVAPTVASPGDSAYPIVLVDPDPIFRLGLRAGLTQTPGLEIVAEAGDSQLALAQLAGLLPQQENPVGVRSHVKLVILEAQLTLNDPATPWLWQRLKQQYPQLALLVLGGPAAVSLVDTAQTMGVEGFIAKGSDISEIVAAVNTLRLGEKIYTLQAPQPSLSSQYPNLLTRWQYHLIQSGLTEMDTLLAMLQTHLGQPQLSGLERLVCQGRQREMRVARALVANWLPKPRRVIPIPPPPAPPPPPPPLPAQLLDQFVSRCQAGLVNQTGEPLELDILKTEKRLELLLVILKQWEDILTALQASGLTMAQLQDKRPQILLDLWQQSIRQFFGPYATLPSQQEITATLLQAQASIEVEFLQKIPLVDQLMAHLLWQQPLMIDNNLQAWGTPAALTHLSQILDNLILQMANAVIHPLLNAFAHEDAIKGLFYDRRVLSFRDMERFRNALSWKYRWQTLVIEPQEIFESRVSLLVLSATGIHKTSLYLPRTPELEQLEGLRYGVTLALEARDAVSPPLRAAIAFIGQGVVYVLTQVIGRGIGLIGRGILQGLGQTFALDVKRAKPKP